MSEDNVMETFQRYVALVRQGEGLAAMLLVDEKTVKIYERLRDLALFATEEELAEQPLAHHLMALRLRAVIGTELSILDGRSLIGLSIQRGWVGGNSGVSLSDLGRLPIRISGDMAEVIIPDAPPGFRGPMFKKEQTWRIDLSGLLEIVGERLQTYFSQGGQSRREFLTEHLQMIDGLRIDEQVWLPLESVARKVTTISHEVPSWAKRLIGDKVEARCLVREVGQSQSIDALVQYLVGNLQDGETEVRLGALKLLCTLSDTSSGYKVLPLLSDHVAHVRACAIDYVADHAEDEVKTKAVPELIFMMRDKFPYIFLRAAEALGNIKDERARQDLEMWAKKHADPDMRETCLNALVRLGATESLTTILYCLRDPVWDVRLAALNAGKSSEKVAEDEEFYDSVVRLSEDENTWVAQRACEILIDFGDQRGLIGLVGVMHKEPDEMRRFTILLTLASAEDPRVVPLLQPFTSDPSSLVRDQAIHVIRQLSRNSEDAQE